MKSYKTTLSGIGVFIAAFGNALNEYLTGGFAAVNISVLITGITTGVGFLFSKDTDVTGGTVIQSTPPTVTIVNASIPAEKP